MLEPENVSENIMLEIYDLLNVEIVKQGNMHLCLYALRDGNVGTGCKSVCLH